MRKYSFSVPEHHEKLEKHNFVKIITELMKAETIPDILLHYYVFLGNMSLFTKEIREKIIKEGGLSRLKELSKI